MKNLKLIVFTLPFLLNCFCGYSISDDFEIFLPVVQIQHDKNPTILAEMRDLGMVMGYWYGIDYWLDRIGNEYPDMALEIQKSKLELEMAFGKGKTKIEDDLKSIMGEEYKSFIDNVRNNIIKTNDAYSFSKADFYNYLSEVSNMAKGDIPSPVKEILLMYQFYETPIAEFSEGFVQIISTEKESKASGLHLKYKIPSTWTTDSGDRPHIVFRHQSERGLGLDNSALFINNLNDELIELNKQQNIGSFFSQEWARDYIPEEATFISYSDFRIDGQPGGKIVYDISYDIAEMTFYYRFAAYVFIYNDKMVLFQESSGSENKPEVAPRFSKMEPLYDAVAGTLVIMNQWE